MRSWGDTNYVKKLIRINKKKSKKNPMHTRPVNKGAQKYPEVLDTIIHEELHATHPKMKHKAIYKKVKRLVKTMSKRQKQRMYNRY